MCYSGVEMWSTWHSVLHQLPAGPNLWYWDDLQAGEVNKLSQLCVIDKHTHTEKYRNTEIRRLWWFFYLQPLLFFFFFSLFLSLDSSIFTFISAPTPHFILVEVEIWNLCVCLLCIIPHAKPRQNYQCYLLTLPPVLNWRQWCGRGVYPPFLFSLSSFLPLSPHPFILLYPPFFPSFCLFPSSHLPHPLPLSFTPPTSSVSPCY